GYQGLIENNIKILNPKDVGNTIHIGGTILKTARSDEFRSKKGRDKAYNNLIKNNIDGLIILGGDGSLTGANIFYEENNFPLLGIPCTIDNDLYGTDYSIGFASARETIVEAVDKIRDTAASHERIFIVEVMGRESGYLAIESGIAAGAEMILIPEYKTNLNSIVDEIKKINKEKKSLIIVYAEGCKFGSLKKLTKAIKTNIEGSNVRHSILGHIQRGGTAVPSDRILGTILGNKCIEFISKGEMNKMVGLIDNKTILNPIDEILKKKKGINTELYKISRMISNY
ncbi:MAG: ATP-dependent 6-phosphofructokinase, partial [Bacteroidota bacterium]|nr:ATP-dependent 6-phosphofructokinase [Bacteroidota bacterium]